MTEETSSFDLEQLCKVLGLPAGTVAVLLADYLRSAATNVEQLRAAVSNNDLTQIRDLAHKLKGSSANFRVTSVANRAQQMEAAAGEGKQEDYTAILNAINSELDIVGKEVAGDT